MKSVSLSQVVRAQSPYRLASPVQSWRELVALTLTLSAGLALLTVLLMMFDPLAPAAWIVIPVLLGGSLPLFAALPGQFDVVTRFDASHLLGTLDASLGDMGYRPAASASADAGAATRCYQRPAGLFHWKERTISLSVQQHAITVGGPLPALRQLKHRLAP
ncbi:hypothetical protein [Massilia sp. DWR3-1-1]|uniref:hypothetical protein n=1 Tax=Massilia sp. DWR3-1-1 TaxID=2804559 RepID=UPI003CF1EB1A